MAPRREALGRQLYVAYRSVCRDTKEDVSRKEALAEQLRQQQEEKQLLLQETEESIGRADQTLGSLRARIAAYDETEEAYHSRYGMSFQRNVLGRYEEGILAIAQEDLERERQQCTDTLKQTQTELDRREKKEQKYISDLSDRKLARQALLHEQAENEEEYRALTEEKDTRREIVRFLQLGLGDTDDDFYDTSGLLAACDRRISEQDVRIRALEEQETRARDELQALEQDRLGELPEHLREGLERLDIPILYGLEWLRRNQKEPSDNLKLVHRNPFLPYALIMTEGEYQRLQKEADELYTSMPVPILLRQDLEQGIMPEADPNTAERLVTLEGHLRFFIHFHEDLLDEEKRDRLICRKQDELNKLHQQLEVRRGERDETIRRRETLRMQRLTLALMEQISKHLAMLQEKLKNSEQELQQLETEREENRQRIQALRKEEIALEERQLTLEDQVHQLETLRARYEQYLKDLVERELLNTERAGLMERKALTRDSIRKCQKECAETEREISLRRRDLEEAEENCRRYESFIPDGDGEESIPEPDREQLMAMEAEYRAITEELSGEVRLLEQSRDHQKERLQRVTEELSAKCRKNGLNADDWAQHPYRQEEEEEGHRQTKQLKQRLKEKETRFHMEDKQVSMLQTRIEDRLAQMQKETGRSAPLPEEEIIPRDYEEALKMLEYACKQLQEEERTLEKRRRDYQDASVGLEGTEEPASGEPLVWEEQFVSMSGEALKKFRTGLVRALDQAREERQKRRNVLSDALNLLLARELFRDPFFHKPLEAMLRMVDQPEEVLRQIELTLQAFDDQLAKAGAELRLIDDEKASIQSGLMDYLRDVHGEIGKIDSNSTIPVRDRSIRMLQITCPSWQENEELYRIRLEDRLKTIIAHCMSLHRAGDRTEEYLGTQINIHALYDGVIGLQNIRIQLYKIEKEREYPIAWSDVAKNSGGEGFLSTFVILTSLLHYIRRDDNDLFADRNEGKVLLMDNPFGLTYSEHLLRPMMELAQKNHTQLICLSGLGGDAIYGRFDNIYVLNLVAARLRNGLQYLRSEHLRGTEPATILPSHIEVVEQQMKLF
ncbi:MAG: hypothetical protein IJT34_03995 [Butyrivibrio sp.]|nr:hypothetical protein [Butyrivibrio sp.]